MYIYYNACVMNSQRTHNISTKNIGITEWRYWLTKYTNKESTFHNIATLISHNHLYISSSDTLVGKISISTATYVGMVVFPLLNF